MSAEVSSSVGRRPAYRFERSTVTWCHNFFGDALSYFCHKRLGTFFFLHSIVLPRTWLEPCGSPASRVESTMTTINDILNGMPLTECLSPNYNNLRKKTRPGRDEVHRFFLTIITLAPILAATAKPSCCHHGPSALAAGPSLHA